MILIFIFSSVFIRIIYLVHEKFCLFNRIFFISLRYGLQFFRQCLSICLFRKFCGYFYIDLQKRKGSLQCDLLSFRCLYYHSLFLYRSLSIFQPHLFYGYFNTGLQIISGKFLHDFLFFGMLSMYFIIFVSTVFVAQIFRAFYCWFTMNIRKVSYRC